MTRKLLLADDSITIRRIVDLAFMDSGFVVDAVESGTEALERLAVAMPDVVLADVQIPGPSGYDLCRAVKEADRSVPVLLLRGAFEPFDDRLAQACGADGDVVKPFEAQGLVARVRALVERANDPAIDAVTGPDDASDAEAEQALDEIVSIDARRPVSDRPTASTPIAAPTVADRVPTAQAGETHVPRVDDDAAPEITVVRPGGTEDESASTVAVRVIAETSAPSDAATDDEWPPAGVAALGEKELDALADRVVRRLSDRVIREIAWEVVPDLASAMIRQRLRELEGTDTDESS